MDKAEFVRKNEVIAESWLLTNLVVNQVVAFSPSTGEHLLLTHAQGTNLRTIYKQTCTRNLPVCMLSCSFFPCTSFLYRIERSSSQRKFYYIQELAWTYIKIWRKTRKFLAWVFLCKFLERVSHVLYFIVVQHFSLTESLHLCLNVNALQCHTGINIRSRDIMPLRLTSLGI